MCFPGNYPPHIRTHPGLPKLIRSLVYGSHPKSFCFTQTKHKNPSGSLLGLFAVGLVAVCPASIQASVVEEGRLRGADQLEERLPKTLVAVDVVVSLAEGKHRRGRFQRQLGQVTKIHSEDFGRLY